MSNTDCLNVKKTSVWTRDRITHDWLRKCKRENCEQQTSGDFCGFIHADALYPCETFEHYLKSNNYDRRSEFESSNLTSDCHKCCKKRTCSTAETCIKDERVYEKESSDKLLSSLELSLMISFIATVTSLCSMRFVFRIWSHLRKNVQKHEQETQTLSNGKLGHQTQTPSNGNLGHQTQTLNSGKHEHQLRTPKNWKLGHQTQALNNGKHEHQSRTPNNRKLEHQTRTPNSGKHGNQIQTLKNGKHEHQSRTPNNGKYEHQSWTPSNGKHEHQTQTLYNGKHEHQSRISSDGKLGRQNQTLNNGKHEHQSWTPNNRKHERQTQALSNGMHEHQRRTPSNGLKPQRQKRRNMWKKKMIRPSGQIGNDTLKTINRSSYQNNREVATKSVEEATKQNNKVSEQCENCKVLMSTNREISSTLNSVVCISQSQQTEHPAAGSENEWCTSATLVKQYKFSNEAKYLSQREIIDAEDCSEYSNKSIENERKVTQVLPLLEGLFDNDDLLLDSESTDKTFATEVLPSLNLMTDFDQDQALIFLKLPDPSILDTEETFPKGSQNIKNECRLSHHTQYAYTTGYPFNTDSKEPLIQNCSTFVTSKEDEGLSKYEYTKEVKTDRSHSKYKCSSFESDIYSENDKEDCEIKKYSEKQIPEKDEFEQDCTNKKELMNQESDQKSIILHTKHYLKGNEENDKNEELPKNISAAEQTGLRKTAEKLVNTVLTEEKAEIPLLDDNEFCSSEDSYLTNSDLGTTSNADNNDHDLCLVNAEGYPSNSGVSDHESAYQRIGSLVSTNTNLLSKETQAKEVIALDGISGLDLKNKDDKRSDHIMSDNCKTIEETVEENSCTESKENHIRVSNNLLDTCGHVDETLTFEDFIEKPVQKDYLSKQRKQSMLRRENNEKKGRNLSENRLSKCQRGPSNCFRRTQNLYPEYRNFTRQCSTTFDTTEYRNNHTKMEDNKLWKTEEVVSLVCQDSGFNSGKSDEFDSEPAKFPAFCGQSSAKQIYECLLKEIKFEKLSFDSFKQLKVLQNSIEDVEQQLLAKEISRELHIEHRSFTIFGLDSYFDRLNNGPPPTTRERMQYEWIRLASFHNYTGNGNALALARNGFYHDHNDGPMSTRCYLCETRNSDWEMLDDISAEHRRQSPNCPFHDNREEESINISITYGDNSETPTRSSLSSTGRAVTSSVTSSSSTSTGAAAMREVSSSFQGINITQTRVGNGGGESIPHQPTEDPESRDRSMLALSQPRAQRALGRTGYSYSTIIAPRRNNVATGAISNVGIDPLNSGSSSLGTGSRLPSTRPSSILGGPVGAGAFTGLRTAGSNTGALTSVSRATEGFQQSNATSTSTEARQTNPAPGAGGRTDPTITVVVDNPKHPDYVNIDSRVSSYQGWPDYLDQTPRQMSEAGFFYVGVADFTRCYCCGGGLRNWEPGDDPMLEHTRWFPRCEYVNKLKGERYVAAVQRRHQEHMAEQQRQQIEIAQRRDENRNPPDPMTTEAAAVMREMGYSVDRTKEAILAVRRQTGSSMVTTQQVLTWLLDDEERRLTGNSSNTELGIRPPPTSTATSLVGTSTPSSVVNTGTSIPSSIVHTGTSIGTSIVNTTSSISTATTIVSAGTATSTVSSSSASIAAEVQQSATSASVTAGGNSSASQNHHTGSGNSSSSNSASRTSIEKQSGASGDASEESKSTAKEDAATAKTTKKKNAKKKAKK